MRIEEYYFTERNAYPKIMVDEYCDMHDLSVDQVLDMLEEMEERDEA